MDWSIFLGIVGIVVTVVIALLIYHLQKIRRYPGRLSASLISMSRVLGEKPEHYLSELSLSLGEYQIEKNLLYVELLLFNERSYDVSAVEGDARVKVTLRDNAKWVDVRIARQADGVGAAVVLENEDRAVFSLGFDLLRGGESVILEGLVETDNLFSRDSLFEEIQLTHRIPNVGETEKLNCPDRKYLRSSKLKLGLFVLFAAFAISALIISLVIKDTIPLRFIDNQTEKSVSLSVDRNDSIKAYPGKWSRRGSYTMTREYFTKNLVPDTEYHRSFEHFYTIIMSGILLLLLILFEWEDFADYRRWKKVSKYLPSEKTT